MTENCCEYEWLRQNIREVRQKIQEAAEKAGRSPSEITLLGVTKTVSQEIVAQALDMGITEIGENKVQEMLAKQPYLQAKPHRTHIIGHLQTNKVKYLPGKADMIQSVDSIRLADKIESVYAAAGLTAEVLVEVNIGEEAGKTGAAPQDTELLCAHIMGLAHLRLKGLMTIPPVCQGDGVRNYFAKMYQLFVDIKTKKLDNKDIDILSMGMSGDFEYAILEGSTMVRVGTSLFGKRHYDI
ncbi:MAG: YggS family pyridoxal phosphate-dependent enzyme [Oscillospiraceae bacterium]|nr:YggS family pyridoxal phosphate-dependent enzyme [Oscillospiraceae bacterium]